MIVQNDFARQWKAIEPSVISAVNRVGASGRYILGKEVEQFESALATYWGLEHAVGVGNGMDALEIALRCGDIRAGEKVLTTSFSAFATALAILRSGGVPVFVDVDDNGNIDLDQCREVLVRDRSIRFCVPVHLYGNPLDLDKLAALRKDFDLFLVEDCAQAIGATSSGGNVGTIGQVAATSFYPTKNLGALGDGGAILTHDATIAARGRSLRHYGQSSLYAHDEFGLNSRLDEVQAAILREASLPNLGDWTKLRRQHAATYLRDIHNPNLTLLKPTAASEPVWHLFPIFTPHRERFREFMRAAEIETGIHYPRVIPDQAAFQGKIRAAIAATPSNARRLAAEEVSLPVHPFLREQEISEVIGACNAFAP
jgi:dTDP-3-amino-3,4,6-trideoxy-alpha-D-glucose transaminase